MEYHNAKYKSLDKDGKIINEDDCKVALAEEGLFVIPNKGKEFYLYYSDIERLKGIDNQIEVLVYDGFRYVFYYFGSYYEQFLHNFVSKRNYQMQKNLLMLDKDYQKEFEASFEFTDSERRTIKDGKAKIILYRNSLVVTPQEEDFFNINYCDIEKIDFEPGKFSLNILLDLGEKLTLTMMGGRFEELKSDIERLIEEMYQRTAEMLKEYFPKGVSEWTILQLSRVLKQGKATKKSEIEEISPDLWGVLPRIIFKRPDEESSQEPDEERKAAFDYLLSLAGPENTYIGIRESFTSSEEELKPIFWFLVAFPKENAIASEVTNEEGHATYFFRIKEDGKPSPDDVKRKVKEINRSMQALNFRRDVIRASDDEIKSDKFSRYRVALRKLPYLNRIRQDFIDRAIHTSEESWRKEVQKILKSTS